MQNKVEMLVVQKIGGSWTPTSRTQVSSQRVARMSNLITILFFGPHHLRQFADLVGYREADTGRVMVSQEQYNQNFS